MELEPSASGWTSRRKPSTFAERTLVLDQTNELGRRYIPRTEYPGSHGEAAERRVAFWGFPSKFPGCDGVFVRLWRISGYYHTSPQVRNTSVRPYVRK